LSTRSVPRSVVAVVRVVPAAETAAVVVVDADAAVVVVGPDVLVVVAEPVACVVVVVVVPPLHAAVTKPNTMMKNMPLCTFAPWIVTYQYERASHLRRAWFS
jgi:hypothetical protein